MRLSHVKYLAVCAALMFGCSSDPEPKANTPGGPHIHNTNNKVEPIDVEPNEELAELMDELAELQSLDADSFILKYDPQLLGGVSYDPVQTANLDVIQQSALALTDDELSVLGGHGFVISKDRQFPSFVYGYETLYMQDMPLYISADSILHAVHRSYDKILTWIEETTLIPELLALLTEMRTKLADGALDTYPEDVRHDVDFYLAVAASLLGDAPAAPVAGADAAKVAEFVDGAVAAEGAGTIKLFGSERLFDYSQFKPRSHYTQSEPLQRYFRATMWLGRVDMRITEPNDLNELVFHRNQLMMAYGIHALIDSTSKARWAKIHDTVGAFVGEPDNMILPELDALLDALELEDAGGLDALSDEQIVTTLQKHGFGTQRISSHIMVSGIYGETKPLSSIFLLLGQRYVLDSHVFSNVVFDRVQHGTVKRMMPDPLDVAFAALGNDQAGVMLADQLHEYGYAPDLASMRLLADAHGADYWTSNLYNLWLGALRTLSPTDVTADPTAHGLPEVAGTEAWGRRILNTQLASWAELRHDTLLYAKQSYTSGAACEFPDAYVDPYPEFFAAIGQFAGHGLQLLSDLGQATPNVTEYFEHLQETMVLLEEMALYQRTGQPFTPAMLAFVNEAVIIHQGCGEPADAEGWYPQLFLNRLDGVEYDPTIADVHTQPTDEAGNMIGRVLHVATGMPRLMVVTADTCEGPRAYVGLASSYFEVVKDNFERLDDETWAAKLMTTSPEEVEWMRDLMVP